MAGSLIIIVDDHPLFRGALSEALKRAISDVAIEEAGSLDELMGKLKAGREPDLVLLDLAMPGVQGLSGLYYLRAEFPAVPVVVVSASEHVSVIQRCIEFGASGFIPKSLPVDQIRGAVRKVLDGEVWTPPGLDLSAGVDSETADLLARIKTLTPQQVRVLGMLGEGMPNKIIAYRLDVSEATVKAHVSAILQKLGVDSRTQAVIAFGKVGSGDWQKPAED